MAKLEYDESGGTFTYFLVLLYGTFLLILTYFLWPGRGRDSNKGKLVCQCGPCCRKRTKLETQLPKEKIKWFARVFVLIALWTFFFLLVYWAVTMETEYEEWDPYGILELDKSATTAEIRKQYRTLSKLYHPDKEGGDQELFMKIAKAYEALTDEESRENWEKYGNPDGPRAATFGIALPSWIVDKQNSIWVLGAYVLVFIVGLPIVVGTWWYRSVKFGSTNILIDTTRLYMYLLSRSKTMPIKRLVMILATAKELSNDQLAGVKDRPSDDVHLNVLVKQLPNVKVDTREQPFCRTYVAKARLLLHAYLEHIEIQDPGLLKDQDALVKYSHHLINEMINCLTQISGLAKMSQQRKGTRRISEPSLDMFENVMRLNQMLVQSLWIPLQPLLQLPHINYDNLRFFINKKKRVASIEDLSAMTNEERRRMLRTLSDEEYQDLIVYFNGFPHVEMTVNTEVADDDDTSVISAGSLVTIRVHLKRIGLLEYHKSSLNKILSLGEEEDGDIPPLLIDEEEMEDERELHVELETSVPDKLQKNPEVSKSSNTRNNKKKKKGKGGGGGKQQVNKKKKGGKQAVPIRETVKENTHKEEDDKEEDEDEEDSEPIDDEEREWKELQKSVKKEKENNNASTKSHPVHSPFFPADKQELWWLYAADRRLNRMVIPPERVAGLQTEKEIRLRFLAPDRIGLHKFTVILMSDSYINLLIQQELKILVHAKKEVSGKEQWADLEKEEEEDDMIEESVTESEEESEED